MRFRSGARLEFNAPAANFKGSFVAEKAHLVDEWAFVFGAGLRGAERQLPVRNETIRTSFKLFVQQTFSFRDFNF